MFRRVIELFHYIYDETDYFIAFWSDNDIEIMIIKNGCAEILFIRQVKTNILRREIKNQEIDFYI